MINPVSTCCNKGLTFLLAFVVFTVCSATVCRFVIVAGISYTCTCNLLAK